jgi:clan AA aspartic protease
VGVFSVTVDVGDQNGRRFVPIEVLVDTGATYTWMPASLLRDLGVTVVDQQEFILANGDSILRDVGQAMLRVDGKERITVIVFGEDDALSLLGAVTLEEMGLGVDPVNRRLIRVPGLAANLPPSTRP